MLKKIISFVLSFSLIITQPIFAQGVAQLNIGTYLHTVGSSLAADRFRPLHMRYFSYDIEADNFQLLLDRGDNNDIKEPELKEKTKVLMEYFQIGLALPNEKFWVNLRPDAPNQMIDPELEKTDMGKVMLEADLQLKRDTAQATSPQTNEGKAYWDKLYKRAGELFGTENITIPTITRPWIVPGEIILRQGEDSAYIFKANMKVMLEHDYLNSQSFDPNSKPLTSNYNFSDPRMKELNEYSSQLIRELIIPKLTKEVNSSKRYASLRQVFFSLVMARWFKDTFKDKSGQYSKLIDSHNLNELTSKEAWDKTYYFNEYKKSFEKGEYNLKEQIHTPAGQMIRSYVSGGLSIGMSSAMEDNHLKGVYSGKNNNKHLVSISTGFLREPGDRNSMFYFSGKTIDGGKIKYFISSAKNGDIEIIDGKSGSALVKNDDDYKNGRKHYPALTITTEPMGNFLDFDFTPYEMKPVKDFSDRLKKSTNPEYILKDIRKWIGGNASKKAVEQATREIMGVVIPYLANEKASVATEAAAIIKDIINYERPAQAMLSLAVGPGLRFLEDRHIEMIADLIRDGIASSEPYLASEALGVILFMAAESKIESRRIDGLSSIRKLADLLLGKLQSHQEIIAQFLKQVERAGAINIDQEKTGLGIAKAVEGAQKSLIALQKSMRGFGSPMIEARPAEDADLILYKQKQKKSLEKKLWVIVKNIEKMLNDEELSGRKNRGEIVISEDSFKGINRISNYLKTLNREGTRIGIDEGKETKEIEEIIRIISETGLRNDSPQVYRVYSGLRLLSLEDSISELEDLKKDWQEFNKLSSSAIEAAVSNALAKSVGGIDFRAMNYMVQPMGSFKDLRFMLPTLSSSALERIDLDKELESLRNMVKAGMVPSGERVKEYLAACFQKGKIEEKQDDLLVCLAEIYRLAEEENLETSPELRESLVIVDTGKFVLLPNNQKVGLN